MVSGLSNASLNSAAQPLGGPHPQKNAISFNSNKQLSIENLSDNALYAISNTPDEVIKRKSLDTEAQKFAHDPMRKVEKRTAQAIPVADTLLEAALTPGSFGDKVFAGIGRALEWGIFLKITNNLSEKLNKNEKYREFVHEHPATASLLGSVAVSTVGVLGYTAVKLGFNKVIEKYEPAKNFKEKIRTDLSELPLGKKISELTNKHSKGIAIAGIIGAVGVIVMLVNQVVSLTRIKKNADRKTEQYKNLRLEASKELNNRLIEKQNQVQED